jgi:8-oxo-dGTP pyrophosphatase MutT (NUDIX family)
LITGTNINELTEERIIDLLKESLEIRPFFEIVQSMQKTSSNARCAAVLMPLVRIEDDWHLLLIKRSEGVADHKGQVAFPGGACETEDDSLEATALRETAEEIGIAPQAVRILGRLRELVTVSSYCVAPIVGVIKWPYELSLSPDEVSRTFTIPLVWLADLKNREKRIQNRSGREVEVIYYKPYDEEVLWGATARMVYNLLEVLGKKVGQV